MSLSAIIAARHGAILADSVGLGKTHVAAALIRQRLADGSAVLVTGPAALAAHWRRHLRACRGWTWCSHTSMSRTGAPPLRGSAPALRALIVVDEAHAFRNPHTRRYRALAALAPDADLLLLTATPVNNSVFDFVHLVRLFATDDAFAYAGVPDLRNAAELAAGGAPALLRRVAAAVMVRRTRAVVMRCHGESIVAGGDAGPTAEALRFPLRLPTRHVRYDLDQRYDGLVAELADSIDVLRFPAHAAAHGDAAQVPVALLRLGLLKRLESSAAAFVASLRRHARLLFEFASAADAGYLLDAGAFRRFMAAPDGAVQLPLPEVALLPWPPHLDRFTYADSARRERERLDELIRRIDGTADGGIGDIADGARDPKVRTLVGIVHGDHAADRVLVFTEFRETAHALWRALRDDGGVGLIDGGGAYLGRGHASRRAVVDRFAPRSSGARSPPAHQAVRILIATDVLAEGLNLQDARVVVSYDLPWNPVRLAQRIGRIDRLGSPHNTIVPVVFVPDRGVDSLLRLMRRLRRKLRDIATIGGDAPDLTAGRRTGAPAAGRLMRPALTDDAGLETVERLRVLAQQVGNEAWPRGADGVPVATASWPASRAATLCWIAAGAVLTPVLVHSRGRVEVDPHAADHLLLEALHVPARPSPVGDAGAVPPTPAALAAAVRRALRHVRDTAPGTGPGRGSAPSRAALAVHAWLRLAGPDVPPGDYSRADAILTWLASPLRPDEEAEIARALAAPGPLSRRIARLESLAAITRESALIEAPRGPAVAVGVLHLVPGNPRCDGGIREPVDGGPGGVSDAVSGG